MRARTSGNRNTLLTAAVVALVGGVVGYAVPQIFKDDPPAPVLAGPEITPAVPLPEMASIPEPMPLPAPAPELPEAPGPASQATAPPARSDDWRQAQVVPRPPVRPDPALADRREPPPLAAVTRARPSFNCRYARTPTEIMICDDPGLARADRRLAQAFETAMDQSDNPRRLRREQDRWLVQREQLDGDRDAVIDHYERRIDELAIE